MNEICFGFHHLTGQSITFSYRHPSSASLCSAASPRGKPRALRASGSPSWRPLQGAGETTVYSNQRSAPPQLRVRSAAPPLGEPRRLRRCGSPSWRPLQVWGKPQATATNEVHSLSLASLASSLKEGAKAAAPQREAKRFPYGGNGGWERRRGACAYARRKEMEEDLKPNRFFTKKIFHFKGKCCKILF